MGNVNNTDILSKMTDDTNEYMVQRRMEEVNDALEGYGNRNEMEGVERLQEELARAPGVPMELDGDVWSRGSIRRSSMTLTELQADFERTRYDRKFARHVSNRLVGVGPELAAEYERMRPVVLELVREKVAAVTRDLLLTPIGTVRCGRLLMKDIDHHEDFKAAIWLVDQGRPLESIWYFLNEISKRSVVLLKTTRYMQDVVATWDLLGAGMDRYFTESNERGNVSVVSARRHYLALQICICNLCYIVAHCLNPEIPLRVNPWVFERNDIHDFRATNGVLAALVEQKLCEW
jgi:hypothetical protein